MALLLVHTRLLATPSYYSSLVPGLRSSSASQPAAWKLVRLRSVARCCAAALENGGFEASGDGGFVAASGTRPALRNFAAADQNRAAQAPAIANFSDSASPGGGALTSPEKAQWIAGAESRIEKAIFNFRFLTLTAISGSLLGSLLCFLKGCGFVCESFIAYFGMCLNGLHTGKVILRLVEAVDVYLVGTVMLIFGMGLYGLFISNESNEGQNDRALKNTTLFGMFALKKRPLWMRITSLDTLKTKLGHVIVMILLVKLFELSKTVHIATSMDLLYYSISIFLSSASLYVLHLLHAS